MVVVVVVVVVWVGVRARTKWLDGYREIAGHLYGATISTITSVAELPNPFSRWRVYAPGVAVAGMAAYAS